LARIATAAGRTASYDVSSPATADVAILLAAAHKAVISGFQLPWQLYRSALVCIIRKYLKNKLKIPEEC
jgi:hypothetical protein